MNLELLNELRPLIDFGLVVLLWLVQWIIYPSFIEIAPDRLLGWHLKYTQRMGYIVAPMMFAQLGLSGWAASQVGWGLAWLDLLLVLSCWGLTFLLSVPLHQRISAGESDRVLLQHLVRTNWPRTLIWSLIFVLGFWR